MLPSVDPLSMTTNEISVSRVCAGEKTSRRYRPRGARAGDAACAVARRGRRVDDVYVVRELPHWEPVAVRAPGSASGRRDGGRGVGGARHSGRDERVPRTEPSSLMRSHPEVSWRTAGSPRRDPPPQGSRGEGLPFGCGGCHCGDSDVSLLRVRGGNGDAQECVRRDPPVPGLRRDAPAEARGLLRLLQLLGRGLPAEAGLVDSEHAAFVGRQPPLLVAAEGSVEAAGDVPAQRPPDTVALADAFRRTAASPALRVVKPRHERPHARIVLP